MRELRATYRVQFHADFTFRDAEAIVPYLADLGISHLYASPVFAARAGSTHGYDVTDPNRLNPELGTEAEFSSLVDALHRAEMGLILDIVPNHMVIHRTNRLLQEALCLGEGAEAARIFDIDWKGGRVSLPVLGGPLESVLNQIRLALDEAGMIMAVYHDHAFALRPASAAALLREAGEGELAGRWERLEDEPRESAFADAAIATARLVGSGPLEAALERADIRGVLDAQRWCLADWRSAASRLSHRRFFNITELIGVRVEDAEVFERTHRLAIDLVRRGDVDGLRIDHIDGLADPAGYCRRLREAVGPDAPIFVEKILGPHETLAEWPVDGTTGYERLNEIGRLFVDPDAYASLDAHLVERGDLAPGFEHRLADAKRQVLSELFAPEVDALVAAAADLGSELGEDARRHAVLTWLVHFPVYRSYVAGAWSPSDEAVWQEALDRARRLDGEDAAAQAASLLEAAKASAAAAAFLTRFQQLSGPAMAKGLEDTELYRSVALTSVNEVGSEPNLPGAAQAETHQAVAARIERGDRSLVPLATHDTKRGPDTRARIAALALDPAGWIAFDAALSAKAAYLAKAEMPDALDRWLIHQTIVGAWPIDRDRLAAYVEKALREAKRHTRWEDPNEAYEAAALRYAAGLVEEPDLAAAVAAKVREIESPARIIGIAQTILQLALPGIPDIYQGTELWDRSLVDPDNRRPVDYERRRTLLRADAVPLAEDGEGAAKLRVTAALLALRREDPDLFLRGAYTGVDAAPDAFAFRLVSRRSDLVVAVPLRGRQTTLRLPQTLVGEREDLCRGPLSLSREMPLPEDWPFLIALRRP